MHILVQSLDVALLLLSLFLGSEHQNKCQKCKFRMQNRSDPRRTTSEGISREISNPNQTFRMTLTSIILELFSPLFIFLAPLSLSLFVPSLQLLQPHRRWLDWSGHNPSQARAASQIKRSTLFACLIVVWYFMSILGSCHGARLKC